MMIYLNLKTISNYGRKAIQNLGIVNNKPVFIGNQISIDGSDDTIEYKSICGECYLKLKNKN